MTKVYAPWTKDQVDSLNGYQKSGVFHEYTCPHGDMLVATEDGWKCGGCEYEQDWAHGMMANWRWKAIEDGAYL